MEGIKLWDKAELGIDFDIDYFSDNYKEILNNKQYLDAKQFLYQELKKDLYDLSI